MCNTIIFHKSTKLGRSKWWVIVCYTSVSGRPRVANIVHNLSMVCEADVELTTNTFGHLENASIATNDNYLPRCAWST